MKKQLILFVLLMSIITLGYSQSISWNVNNVNSWIDAVNGIRNGGNNRTHNITITGNISVPSSTENTFGSVIGVTVTIQGNGSLISSSNGNLLLLGTGQAVIVRDITLQGRNNNNSSVVMISGEATFRMESNASVTGNTSSSDGGGVFIDGGTFIMQDNSSVTRNTSTNRSGNRFGGRVFVRGGNFTIRNNASITGNYIIANADSLGNSYAYGGGLYIIGSTFNMEGGSISNNTAIAAGTLGTRAYGGGVYFSGGTFTMQDGIISGNTARYDNERAGRIMYMGSGRNPVYWADGGGIYMGSGTFNMRGGIISSNNTSDNGGGVCVLRGTFNMHGNASVSNNTATQGGGVYLGTEAGTIFSDQSTNFRHFNMQGNASVSNNTANQGGGVLIVEGTFTMLENSSLSGNIAINGGGGMCSTNATFIMRGNATVSGNTARNGGGGGVCPGGIFNMEGGTIFGNIANNLGGGVLLGGDINFLKTGGIIYGNNAEQSLRNTLTSSNERGNAIYDANNTRWRNASALAEMSTNTYGFWLNEESINQTQQTNPTQSTSVLSGTYNYSSDMSITFNGNNYSLRTSSANYSGSYSIIGNTFTLSGHNSTTGWIRGIWTIRNSNTIIDSDGDSWIKR